MLQVISQINVHIGKEVIELREKELLRFRNLSHPHRFAISVADLIEIAEQTYRINDFIIKKVVSTPVTYQVTVYTR